MKSTFASYGPLVAGFVISAFLMTGIWRQTGDALGLSGQSGPIAAVTASGLLVVALLELTTVRRSLLVRQTPRTLPEHFGAIAGGFGWGLDTGSMLSTYRTSFATWATLGLCFTGFASPLTGLAYAIGFCAPLGATLFVKPLPGPRPASDTNDFVMGINAHRRTLQLLIAPLILLAAIYVLSR